VYIIYQNLLDSCYKDRRHGDFPVTVPPMCGCRRFDAGRPSGWTAARFRLTFASNDEGSLSLPGYDQWHLRRGLLERVNRTTSKFAWIAPGFSNSFLRKPPKLLGLRQILFSSIIYFTELLGFRTLSIVRILIITRNRTNTTFRKLDLFPSSGEGRHLFCLVPYKELTSITGQHCQEHLRPG
jgi:hypothetical protein